MAKDLYLVVNLHTKLIFFGNFIWGVLQILCRMKLVSYKMPSQILHWSEDHLDYIALACLLTNLPTSVHAYQLVNIFYLILQIVLISFAGMWITDSWAYLWAVNRYYSTSSSTDSYCILTLIYSETPYVSVKFNSYCCQFVICFTFQYWQL